MGLDITWYTGLTKAEANEGLDKDGYAREEDGYFRFPRNHDFPGRADEIDFERAYKADDEGDFAAGSYLGYGVWRNQLAALAGYPKSPSPEHSSMAHAASVWESTKPGPFMELINFSDCEGVLGTAVSAKLAADFAQFQEKADAHESERFREKYALWREAFEKASNGGAVHFH